MHPTQPTPSESGSTHRVETSGIEFVWSPETRIARMDFLRPDSFGTGPDARVLTGALRGWGQEGEGPYAMLVDAEQTSSVDAEYRAVFYEFFDAERERAYAAWFNARPHVQAIIDMFMTAVRAGGPFTAAYFDSEEEARAWLREQGVGH